MKVTFAQMGNYSIAIKDLIEKLGCQFVAPDPTNQETVKEGVQIAPETICFPCKLNLGNYLSAIRNGADTILMFDSQGQCRFRYYGMLQRKILKDYGYQVSFVIFSARDFWSQMDCLGHVSAWQKINIFRSVWKKIKTIELIEDLAKFYRPREIDRGETDKIMKECLEKMDQIKTLRQLARYKYQVGQKFGQIKINPQKDILKVGIIGEIFTVIDEFTNQKIESVLGKLGAEIHRDLTLSTFIKHSLSPWHNWQVKKQAKGYLDFIVGGHGLESVTDMLGYAKKEFDGVIHLWPFGCMPEITVRPILDKIKQDSGLPLLGLSLDEQSGQAGLQTRLEAFVDLMRSKKNRKKL